MDFHAEATAEKLALAWHLDGEISALVGTHTHVQTADETILPGGMAYITDAGMTGAFDSVIGMDKEVALKRFITQLPVSYQAASEGPAPQWRGHWRGSRNRKSLVHPAHSAADGFIM